MRKDSLLSRAIAMPYVVGWIIGFVFSFVGGIVAVVAGGPSVRYVASYSWPQVPATVHSVEMTTAPTPRQSVQAWVRPVLEFQYNDQRFLAKADDLFGMGDLDLARVEARVQELRTNPHVQVLVDPGDPARSVLQRGSLGVFLLYGLVWLFPLIGVVALAITTMAFAYNEAGCPRKGLLGLWGRFMAMEVPEKVWTIWGIRLLVAIPMCIIVTGLVLQNWILVGIGAFLGYGVWQAARGPKGQRRR